MNAIEKGFLPWAFFHLYRKGQNRECCSRLYNTFLEKINFPVLCNLQISHCQMPACGDFISSDPILRYLQ
jgi:hypothetical protein